MSHNAYRQRAAVLNTLRTIALTEQLRAAVALRFRNSVIMALDPITEARVQLACNYLGRTSNAVR
jgi:hypothetical protein